MADITWSNVLDYAPELEDFDDDAQTDVLAYVNDEALDPDIFGGDDSTTFKLARIYLAAHMATTSMNGDSATAGPVIGESAGGLSRQYANTSGSVSDPLLDSTSYGREYQRLVRRSLARVPYVI